MENEFQDLYEDYEDDYLDLDFLLYDQDEEDYDQYQY